jgi:hypothetical protein
MAEDAAESGSRKDPQKIEKPVGENNADRLFHSEPLQFPVEPFPADREPIDQRIALLWIERGARGKRGLVCDYCHAARIAEVGARLILYESLFLRLLPASQEKIS